MCIQNKYLAVEINPNNLVDITKLQSLEEDVRRLFATVKHDVYNPKSTTKTEIELRHKSFLQVMVKYANTKEVNGLVSVQEGPETTPGKVADGSQSGE